MEVRTDPPMPVCVLVLKERAAAETLFTALQDAGTPLLRVALVAPEKADTGDPSHVAAPMTGVFTLSVEQGASVEAGQKIGTVEAMKMESSITAHASGTVDRLAVSSGTKIEPGDLLLVLSG